MKNDRIDGGKVFDWGRFSADYAKYRDIYPQEFYQRILDMGFCKKGQKVLDLGTGTGVIPRNLYAYGASFTGIDCSENQIKQAKILAARENMDITFRWEAAERCSFEKGSFDVVTACQCFTYFDHEILAPHLHKILKKGGNAVILYMAWLPEEDKIARESEALILKYNPDWSGCRETRHPIFIPEAYRKYFSVECEEVFDLKVPFTRESWHGRIKACRGVGASLTEEEIKRFDEEHRTLLEKIAPKQFSVLHYAAITVLK